jgi:tetratricopeptide (TPR) repeat protein
LADSYSLLGKAGLVPPGTAIPKAHAAAKKALEIDDTLAEAHTALANVLFDDWDAAGAERELKRALELNPNYSVARYWYSAFLAVMGRWPEAFAEIERAREIDPLSLVVQGHLAFMYYFARRYDEAIEQCLNILKMDPNFVRARLCLGLVYAQKGEFSEAIAAVQEAQQLTDTPQVMATLGVIYGLSGKRHKAQQVLAELNEKKNRFHFSAFNFASIYASTGDNDEAFKYLRKACESRSIELVWLNVNPIFDGMRQDPRFAILLSRIGLSQDETLRPAKLPGETRGTKIMLEEWPSTHKLPSE